MANPSNEVQLVVTVEVDKANQSIKSVNANLSGIEQSAVRAARGASGGIDGMTASMVKGATAGNLLADAIKKAIEFAKEWTIEAAKEAAHLDRAEQITRGLAKAHGDGAAAAQKAIEAIREVGYTAKDATTSVQKLVIADIGLDKAKGLAKIAKDAAAMSTEGISAAEAFEKIILAIETGQSRGLRSLSLFPDLAKAEEVAVFQAKMHGRTLDENQIKLTRHNAIVEAATKIQGAAAQAVGTFDGEMKRLSREIADLKDEVGKAFQGELRAVVGHLRDLVGWLKDNTDWLEKFGNMAIWLAGVLATYAVATKISGIGAALTEVTAAIAANPMALLITGVVAAGAIVYKEYNDMAEARERWIKSQQNEWTRKDLFSGKLKVDDLRKRGMTDEQIRELISGRKLAPGETGLEGLEGFQTGITIGGGKKGPMPEELKLQLEVQKRQRENAEYFADKAIGTRLTTLIVNGKPMRVAPSGYAKDVAEINADIAKRTTFVDDMGVHSVPLTKKAWDSVLEYASNKFAAFKQKVSDDNRKELAEVLKLIEEEADRRNQFEAKRLQDRVRNDAEIAEKNLDHLRDVYAFEVQRAGFERDAKLRRLEGIDAQTIQQKVAIEQEKANIEIEYLQKVQAIKDKLYDLETDRILMEERLLMERLGYRQSEIRRRLQELEDHRNEIANQSDEANNEAITAARENAANRAAQLVRDHNRQIFDSLKQQAGGVFDALLQKSQSVWKSIGNALKTALLTAIKDVVTSRIAGMLMGVLYGTKVSFAREGGMAGTPVFSGAAGGSGMGLLSMFGGGGQGQTIQIVGGGSGTGAGGETVVVNSGGAGGGLAMPGMGGTGNMMFGKPATIWQNLKGFAGFGNVTTDSQGGRWVTIGNQSVNIDSLGGKMTAAGRSQLAGMLGLGAFMYGLSHKGAKGDAALIGGGALAGFQMGGPWGAAGGAAVGSFIAGVRRGGFAGWAETGFNPIAGLFMLFGGSKLLRGASEKAREKIKDLYGIDIDDQKVLQQIVDIAKQTYAGNLDMAIRTPQVRDLIQLYAMSTGKQLRGMSAAPHPLDLVQSGGSLYQSPGYSNGAPLPGLGGLPVFDSIGAGAMSGGGLGTTVVNLQIDSTNVGSVVLQNGRVVAQGMVSAMKSNIGRRSMASLQLSPGLVTQ